MPLTLQAINDLPDDVLIDVGFLFEGNTFVGTSRGGLTFAPQIERRNIEYDGKKANVAEMDRDTFSGAQITGTLIQFVSKLSIFEPGSTQTDPGGNVSALITPQTGGQLYAAGDYLTNLRLVHPTRAGGYVQVRFPVALCTQYTVSGQDRSEAEIAATFEARLSLSDAAATPGKKPYVIELLDTFS
jgi:hypothetical protein